MKKTTKDTITVVSFFVSMIAFLCVIIISIYVRREAINNIFVHIIGHTMFQSPIALLFLVALVVACLSFAVFILFDKLSERIAEKDYDYIVKCLKEEGTGEFLTDGKISDNCIAYFKEKNIGVVRIFDDHLMFHKEGVGENNK